MNSNTGTKLRTAIFCALGAAVFIASAADAATQNFPTETVRFADLDISKPAGAEALFNRIRAAARDVCQTQARVYWTDVPSEHACIEQAIDNAVKKVNSPELTTLRFGSDIRLASK